MIGSLEPADFLSGSKLKRGSEKVHQIHAGEKKFIKCMRAKKGNQIHAGEKR